MVTEKVRERQVYAVSKFECTKLEVSNSQYLFLLTSISSRRRFIRGSGQLQKQKRKKKKKKVQSIQYTLPQIQIGHFLHYNSHICKHRQVLHAFRYNIMALCSEKFAAPGYCVSWCSQSFLLFKNNNVIGQTIISIVIYTVSTQQMTSGFSQQDVDNNLYHTFEPIMLSRCPHCTLSDGAKRHL